MQNIDIKHTRADDYSQTLKLTANSVAVNLTGCELVFSMKNNITDTEYVLQKELVITDETGGETKLILTGEETDLDLKSYYYDIQLTDSAGFVTTIIKGFFIITYHIT